MRGARKPEDPREDASDPNRPVAAREAAAIQSPDSLASRSADERAAIVGSWSRTIGNGAVARMLGRQAAATDQEQEETVPTLAELKAALGEIGLPPVSEWDELLKNLKGPSAEADVGPGGPRHSGPDPSAPASPELPNAFEDPVPAAAEAVIGALGDATLSGAQWRILLEVLKRPRRQRKTAQLPAALFDPAVLDLIAKVPTRKEPFVPQQEAAAKAIDELIERVFRDRLGRTSTEAEAEPDDEQLAAEWARLAPIQALFEENMRSPQGWATIRRAFLADFGGLAHGAEAAIGFALDYYKSLKPGRLFGRNIGYVHPDFAAALARAEGMVKRTPGDVTGWATTIRFNVNAPTVLSDHSFGTAIDINAATSPNVTDFPFDTIATITGADLRERGDDLTTDDRNLVHTGDPKEGSKQREAGSFDEVYKEAERLQVASDVLERALQDENGLLEAFERIAQQQGCAITDPVELSSRAGAAADEKVGPEQWEWPPSTTKKPAAGKKRATAHGQLAELCFPLENQELGQSGGDPERTRRTVNAFVWLITAWRQSFAKGKKAKGPEDEFGRKRVAPEARSPNAGQLGYHGFLNIPPDVVAGLASKEGGGLRWLGANQSTTKDFMHFELHDRPKLHP